MLLLRLAQRALAAPRPRMVNPALLALLRPASKVLAVLVGRGFRKWWQALPKHKKQILIDHLRRNRVRYAVGSGVAATAGVVYYHNHVTVAPYTGRHRFMLLTTDQLFSMAGQLYQMEMEQYAHLMVPEHHPMLERVQRVGNRLLQANNTLPELYTKVWTVSVIDDPTMNCFVLPSGDIVMFTGMMDALENDDQVAAVLAHEMSHAILDHAAEHLNRGYLLDLVVLVPVALIWAVLPSDLLAVASHWLFNLVVKLFLTLPYSRLLETEADYLGLRLAAKACYDVREFSALWGKMDVLEKIMDKNGQGAEVPAWLSTHPTNEDRQRELEGQMAEALDLRTSCKCPPLTPRDPREPIRRLQRGVAQEDPQVTPVAIPLQKPLPPPAARIGTVTAS
ncbi:Metalloendopeptidase OMA1, mitochondrial [Chionoecetes opilio]|uniref:Metalloendopeptidase OMA1, mitochondrial n=1 Tax=Chionoecetes opilio TaxID=41210 RepID=A0A8J4YDT9_CHIOP|nr:Metalloendopeptidase OMA1, mitochondrial [Chionoecetes opilio]